jgi:hypothetical protein
MTAPQADIAMSAQKEYSTPLWTERFNVNPLRAIHKYIHEAHTDKELYISVQCTDSPLITKYTYYRIIY